MRRRKRHVEAQARSFGMWVTLWLAAFGAYVIALVAGGPLHAEVVHVVAWTSMPILAGLSCWFTARRVTSQRRAWSTLAVACASWFAGHVTWLIDTYALARESSLPSPSKIFYLAYAALLVRALSQLSDSDTPQRFTMQHLGNLGLIACCLAVTIVIAFMEPMLQPATTVAVLGSLVHSTLVAATFFAALYYLWSRQWHATWASLLLLTAATAIYALGNFVYVHALVTQTYRPTDGVNVTWAAMFVFIALAAHRRVTEPAPDGVAQASVFAIVARRSRLLEAAVPAMLIVTMVAVGASAGPQLSPRVLAVTGALLLAFALILGAREAWIQGESQRLTLALRNANERLRGMNLELLDSEARVRDLHAHLEVRVAARTRQLQVAYEELEGFAYAVAHDLKAPLRAIDGFGHMLGESLSDRRDPTTNSYLNRIRRSAAKMSVLIEDLLAYSRIERRPLVEQQLDLATIVAGVVDECMPEVTARRIELAIDVPPIMLSADAEALTLVVRNLFHNALKFTRDVPAPRIGIHARAEPLQVALSVRDNGIGFDMQYHEQIFGLFHRLHRDGDYPGTGIGLALVRKALERMNGTVHAQSSDGGGATFHVHLRTERGGG